MDRKERFEDTAIDENDTSAAAIAFDRIVANCLELEWVVDAEVAARLDRVVDLRTALTV